MKPDLTKINPMPPIIWRDMIVKNRCLCIDKRIVIQHAIKEAVLKDIHLTHPCSFALLSLAEHWDFLARDSESKACTDIGKKIKSVIPRSKWSPLTRCREPNEELQIDFCV